jgi:hypothetical protein
MMVRPPALPARFPLRPFVRSTRIRALKMDHSVLFPYRFVDRRVTDYHGGINTKVPARPPRGSLRMGFASRGPLTVRCTTACGFAFASELALAPLGVHAPRVRGVLENEYRVRALHDSG